MSWLIWLLTLLAMGGLQATDELDGVEGAWPRLVPAAVPVGGSDEDVGRWFENRPDFRVCGYLERHYPPWDVAGGWQCLQAGVRADGAELVVLDVDVEGLDRQHYFRTTPAGRLEIAVHTDRKLGDERPRWEVRECLPSADLQARPCARRRP